MLANSGFRQSNRRRFKATTFPTRKHHVPILMVFLRPPGRNAGFVNVGTDHDTGAFAVASIRGWWHFEGRRLYPNAGMILITADGGEQWIALETMEVGIAEVC